MDPNDLPIGSQRIQIVSNRTLRTAQLLGQVGHTQGRVALHEAKQPLSAFKSSQWRPLRLL
jgi:hypothetical protein